VKMFVPNVYNFKVNHLTSEDVRVSVAYKESCNIFAFPTHSFQWRERSAT
jgi:hypothetical protein